MANERNDTENPDRPADPARRTPFRGAFAGFAVRRVPPVAPEASQPWRIAALPSNDGNSNQDPAAAARPATPPNDGNSPSAPGRGARPASDGKTARPAAAADPEAPLRSPNDGNLNRPRAGLLPPRTIRPRSANDGKLNRTDSHALAQQAFLDQVLSDGHEAGDAGHDSQTEEYFPSDRGIEGGDGFQGPHGEPDYESDAGRQAAASRQQHNHRAAGAGRDGQTARSGKPGFVPPPVREPSRAPTTPPRPPAVAPSRLDADDAFFETMPEPSAAPAAASPAAGPERSGLAPPLRPQAAAEVTTRNTPTIVREETIGSRRSADDPSGPDADRTRLLSQALEDKARAKRAKRLKLDPDSDKPAAPDYVATAETQAAYMARGKSLVQRYQREGGVHGAQEDVDPLDFVNWLFSIKSTVKPNSWRLYRASAMARIQTVPHDNLDEALALLEDDVGRGIDDGKTEYRGRRSVASLNSERAKKIDIADFNKVLTSVRMLSRSQSVPWLCDWMVAGIHTGLRPMEWAMADLEVRPDSNRLRGRRVWLHVVNAKSTFGRANGSHRTLDISDYTDDSYEAISRMVGRASEWTLAGEYELRQSQVAQLFYEITNALFPRRAIRYSMYTLRHQFIANMKTVHPRAELAALVGHISVETQSEHYGKRRASWMTHEITEIPTPIVEQVANVRKRIELFDNRIKMNALKRQTQVGRGGEAAEEPMIAAVAAAAPQPQPGARPVQAPEAATGVPARPEVPGGTS